MGQRNATASKSAIISTAQPKYGTKSAAFDGTRGNQTNYATNYPLITLPSATFTNDGISVCFWIYRVGNSSTDSHIFGIGNLYVWLQSTSTTCQVNNVGATGFSITTSAWRHIVITVSSTGNTNVYLDKVQTITDQSITSGNYPSGANTGRIGGVPANNGGSCINGYIDDFRVYNKLLNATEISTVYDGNKPIWVGRCPYVV